MNKLWIIPQFPWHFANFAYLLVSQEGGPFSECATLRMCSGLISPKQLWMQETKLLWAKHVNTVERIIWMISLAAQPMPWVHSGWAWFSQHCCSFSRAHFILWPCTLEMPLMKVSHGMSRLHIWTGIANRIGLYPKGTHHSFLRLHAMWAMKRLFVYLVCRVVLPVLPAMYPQQC